jgi:hypothetical protein
MTTHHVLPGSIEMDGTIVKAAVHTGPSEWTPQNLRYVQADVSAGKKGDSILPFLANVYDNSEGCLLNGNVNYRALKDRASASGGFQMKARLRFLF